MDKEPTNAEIKKEFTCNGCRCEFEEIYSFTMYGGDKRLQDYQKGRTYCEPCIIEFEKKL